MDYEKEYLRLKEICYDIADTVNTSPYLYQEPVDYDKVLRKIDFLAVSGYSPEILSEREKYDID